VPSARDSSYITKRSERYFVSYVHDHFPGLSVLASQ
jgi:hypothetical protein